MGILEEIMDQVPDTEEGVEDGEPKKKEEQQDEGKKRMHEYSDDFVKTYGQRKE